MASLLWIAPHANPTKSTDVLWAGSEAPAGREFRQDTLVTSAGPVYDWTGNSARVTWPYEECRAVNS